VVTSKHEGKSELGRAARDSLPGRYAPDTALAGRRAQLEAADAAWEACAERGRCALFDVPTCPCRARCELALEELSGVGSDA
jgi:hypothetical protein